MRKQILGWIKIAGYHQDSAKFIRLYIENRINFTVANKAYQEGYRLKLGGMKCTCTSCNENKIAA